MKQEKSHFAAALRIYSQSRQKNKAVPSATGRQVQPYLLLFVFYWAGAAGSAGATPLLSSGGSGGGAKAAWAAA